MIEGQQYIKDLKYLNRPIHRVIVIDNKPERIAKYYENSIILDTYSGQAEDNSLNELLPLLDRRAECGGGGGEDEAPGWGGS